MNLSVNKIKNLPKPFLLSIALTTGAVVAGIAMVFFIIRPMQASNVALQGQVTELERTVATMKADIKQAEQQAKKTAQLRAERDLIVTKGMVEPYLGSLWMGAKSIMGPIAQRTGFKLESVKDHPSVLLRLPPVVPDQVYARQPIEFVGRGSYGQIVKFIQETEETYPLTILSNLDILSQVQTPETHRAVITFEWPVKQEWLQTGSAGQR